MIRWLRGVLWTAGAGLTRREIYAFLRQELSQLEEGISVLNVGSSGVVNVMVRRYARERNFRITSADIDPARNPDRVDDITKSSFEDECFDAVVIMEVLEHVERPHAAAEEIKRILKPGGRLLLSTPFIFPLHDRPYDFFRYTKYGLQYLFKGFEELSIREQTGWAEVLLILIFRLSAEKSWATKILGAIVLPFAYLLLPVAYLAARVIRTDYMTSGYLLKARKPRLS